MARQSSVNLYGFVEEKPRIIVDKNTHEPVSAIAYLHVVRGVRETNDGKKYMKHDHPLIVAMEPHVVKKMAEWQINDTIYIKGIVATKDMDKKSYCPNCTDAEGKQTENIGKGQITYVNPIYVKKMLHFETKEEALTDIIKAREISNQVVILGNLVNDPGYFKTKRGLIVTQYQIYANRKYRIKEDDPDTRTDKPWIKSYGDQALQDKMRLYGPKEQEDGKKHSSEVIIDGCLQARKVHRQISCKCCGQNYIWEDQTMEIVPFAVEYVKYFKDDNILEAEEGRKAEEILNELYNRKHKDVITEDMNTDDLDTEDQS